MDERESVQIFFSWFGADGRGCGLQQKFSK